MNAQIEQAATKNLDRQIGNVLGYTAVVISLFLWAFYFFSPAGTSIIGSNSARIVWLVAISAILPLFAGWKSSRLWFLMLLSPLALFVMYKFF